ncbi:MAG: alpha/beta hydrolase [Verrucomicrobiota bacterium JB022]|nr:alpha/beta hydrolase [Verrucomicrobiota bacterium JB022]
MNILSAGPELIRDVAFLPAGRGETLDVYLPVERFDRPLPAVLLIHGGGWLHGDKAEARTASIANDLVEAGYAVFSTDYLLNVGGRDEEIVLRITELAWPQSLLDCAAALSFVQTNAERYHIDPDRIGVLGCSAGGHLAMMLGIPSALQAWSEEEGNREASFGKVACVITSYGVADLRGQRLTPFPGSEDASDLALEAKASPLLYIGPDSPPFLVVHGTADKTINVDQSRTLVERLAELDVPHRYVEIEGAPHSFDLRPSELDLRPVVLDFLAEHLSAKE